VTLITLMIFTSDGLLLGQTINRTAHYGKTVTESEGNLYRALRVSVAYLSARKSPRRHGDIAQGLQIKKLSFQRVLVQFQRPSLTALRAFLSMTAR
jgi:hypothetical protein